MFDIEFIGYITVFNTVILFAYFIFSIIRALADG